MVGTSAMIGVVMISPESEAFIKVAIAPRMRKRKQEVPQRLQAGQHRAHLGGIESPSEGERVPRIVPGGSA